MILKCNKILFLTYFPLVLFIITKNTSSFLDLLVHLYMRTSVAQRTSCRSSISCHVLADVFAGSNYSSYFSFLVLSINNISDFDSVDNIFYITPEEKIRLCNVGEQGGQGMGP